MNDENKVKKEYPAYRVCDSGVYFGTESMGKMIITKEAFIEAYNRFIKGKYE